MTGNVLEVEGLTVRFGGVVALENVKLDVPGGAVRGLIGPNGAGKSTLFNAISGLVPIAAGNIRVDGTDVAKRQAHERASLGVQRTFQSIQLIKSMTVLENILTGLHAGATAPGKLGRRASDVDRASAIAVVLGLGGDLYRLTEGLTFRQQRYVEIARALVSEPRLVMLDEPAAGLSGPEIQELGDRLIDLQSRFGFAVLLVEHVIPLVTRVCPYVTVLENGSVLASGPGPEVMAHPDVVRAYLGDGVHA